MQNNNVADVKNCSLAFDLVSLGNELLQMTCEVDHCSLASNYIDEADFQIIGHKFNESKVLLYINYQLDALIIIYS